MIYNDDDGGGSGGNKDVWILYDRVTEIHEVLHSNEFEKNWKCCANSPILPLNVYNFSFDINSMSLEEKVQHMWNAFGIKYSRVSRTVSLCSNADGRKLPQVKPITLH